MISRRLQTIDKVNTRIKACGKTTPETHYRSSSLPDNAIKNLHTDRSFWRVKKVQRWDRDRAIGKDISRIFRFSELENMAVSSYCAPISTTSEKSNTKHMKQGINESP